MFEKECDEFIANCTKADGCHDCDCQAAFKRGVSVFAKEVGKNSGFWGRATSRFQNELRELKIKLLNTQRQLTASQLAVERYEEHIKEMEI